MNPPRLLSIRKDPPSDKDSVRYRSPGGLLIGLLCLVLAVLAGSYLHAIGVISIGGPKAVTDGVQSVSSVTLSADFGELAELSVEEYSFKDIGMFTEGDKQIFKWLSVPLTSKNFTITYSGTVKAGVKDLSAVKFEVNDAKQEVRVTVPDVQVISSSIDPKSVKVFDESHNPLNQIEVKDIMGFQAEREKASVDEAVASGLLTKASKRTESLIGNHVKSVLAGTDKASYKVKIVWAKAPAPTATASFPAGS